MADIELVIKIPEDTYQYVMNTGTYGHYRFNSARAIRNSTPLPKGHGRLIDADVLVDSMEDDYEFCEYVNATPTIIESGKEDLRCR